MNRPSFQIIIPVILAITFVAGIFIGNLLDNDSKQIPTFIQPKASKFDKILELIGDEYVDVIYEDSLTELAITEMLEKLDPHSIYIPADIANAVAEPLEGNFDGIGVQFNIQNDTILVINTISGGPAEKVGILAGDRIVSINDTIVAGRKITNDYVMKNLKGKRGTQVNVGIKRRGYDQIMKFDIVRDKIPLTSLDASYMITSEIGFIKISRFARTTYQEFVDAAKALSAQGMKSMILDLRGNGGGYLDAATNIADEFLADGEQIVYTEGQNRPRSEYNATANGICESFKVVILVDTWSASASEILAGAIQDNDRGIVIGRRTFGKGLVQEPIQFRDGSVIRLTTSRYYTPSGRSIQKPYHGNSMEYEDEILERMKHGEMEYADSIHNGDTLKFQTKNGRTVYGGGGITPDIFIPVDTIGVTSFYKRVAAEGIIYRFALQYSDNHREALKGMKDLKSFENYLDKQNIWSSFITYAQKAKINTQSISSDTKHLINTQIKAYVVRNFLDENNFFKVFQSDDKAILKATDYLQTNSKYDSILKP